MSEGFENKSADILKNSHNQQKSIEVVDIGNSTESSGAIC